MCLMQIIGLVTRLRTAPASLHTDGQPMTHLFSNSQWEIDMNEITMMKEIGSGKWHLSKGFFEFLFNYYYGVFFEVLTSMD